jgi:NADH:ubiquinone oxidoreductase subunit 4 (subunit M)
MIVGLLGLGLYPQPVLNSSAKALDNSQVQLPMASLRR